jgi:hypothetical protein
MGDWARENLDKLLAQAADERHLGFPQVADFRKIELFGWPVTEVGLSWLSFVGFTAERTTPLARLERQ